MAISLRTTNFDEPRLADFEGTLDSEGIDFDLWIFDLEGHSEVTLQNKMLNYVNQKPFIAQLAASALDPVFVREDTLYQSQYLTSALRAIRRARDQRPALAAALQGVIVNEWSDQWWRVRQVDEDEEQCNIHHRYVQSRCNVIDRDRSTDFVYNTGEYNGLTMQVWFSLLCQITALFNGELPLHA